LLVFGQIAFFDRKNQMHVASRYFGRVNWRVKKIFPGIPKHIFKRRLARAFRLKAILWRFFTIFRTRFARESDGLDHDIYRTFWAGADCPLACLSLG